MSKARGISNLVDTDGDVVSGALDNVPPSNDASALTTGTLPVDRVPYIGRRNLIINGAMQIFQRNTSSTANNAYSVDRWQHKDAASNVAMTITQDTDVPTGQGFYYSLKASTTANTTANGFLGVAQRMEGYNINPLAWGTSGAKQATVSFWVKSSTAGTYALSSRNNAADLACVMEYTINAADTWEYKTVTFPAVTNGTWETTTGIGNRLWWGLSATGGNTSTIGSWQSANVYQSSNNADWSGSTATATFYITGVQLEVGSVATPFEHRSYGEELALCQRYYQRINYGTAPSVICNGFYYTASHIRGVYNPPVVFRGTPSLDVPSSTGIFGILRNGSSDTFNTLLSGNSTPSAVMIYQTTNVSGTAGWAGEIRLQTSDAYFGLEAEL